MDPVRLQFCKSVPPFLLPEVKFLVSYPLPCDVQASVVFQSLPGFPIGAGYIATNAEICAIAGSQLGGLRHPGTLYGHLPGDADGTQSGVRGPQRAARYSDSPSTSAGTGANPGDVRHLQHLQRERRWRLGHPLGARLAAAKRDDGRASGEGWRAG